MDLENQAHLVALEKQLIEWEEYSEEQILEDLEPTQILDMINTLDSIHQNLSEQLRQEKHIDG